MLVRRYYQLIEIAVKEFRIIALAGDNVRQLMQDEENLLLGIIRKDNGIT